MLGVGAPYEVGAHAPLQKIPGSTTAFTRFSFKYFQEKEKELDVRNIYSMRVVKPPHKLNSAITSSSSTPAPSSRRSTGHQRKNSDPLSPHHRRNQKAAMQEVYDPVFHLHELNVLQLLSYAGKIFSYFKWCYLFNLKNAC